MFNALAARCVWHCGVLLRLLLAAPLLVLVACCLLSVVAMAMRCAAAKQLAARGFLAARHCSRELAPDSHRRGGQGGRSTRAGDAFRLPEPPCNEQAKSAATRGKI